MARGGGTRGVVVSDAQSRLPGGVRGARAPCPGAGGRAVGAARSLGRRRRPDCAHEPVHCPRACAPGDRVQPVAEPLLHRRSGRPNAPRRILRNARKLSRGGVRFAARGLMLTADGDSWNRGASARTSDPLVTLGAGTIITLRRRFPSLRGSSFVWATGFPKISAAPAFPDFEISPCFTGISCFLWLPPKATQRQHFSAVRFRAPKLD